MENTSYALQMAIGTLIAIMLISILVFFWQKFGIMEKAKDDSQDVKNRADFNAEWQAYEKNLMYGSDVLSCINKAQNNNQKYVYNNYYGTDSESIGKDSRDEYFVDVQVQIKTPLCEKIEAYWKNSSGDFKKVVGGLAPGFMSNYDYKIFNESSTMHFDMPKVYYYYFKNGKLYQEAKNYTDVMGINKNITLYNILTPTGTAQAGIIETKFDAGKIYNLLEVGDVVDETTASTLASRNESAYLAALISTVSSKQQKIINKDTPTSTIEKEDWWYCTWTPATSDFKSRKFKCTGVQLNSKTGYVNKITFEEI